MSLFLSLSLSPLTKITDIIYVYKYICMYVYIYIYQLVQKSSGMVMVKEAGEPYVRNFWEGVGGGHWRAHLRAPVDG